MTIKDGDIFLKNLYSLTPLHEQHQIYAFMKAAASKISNEDQVWRAFYTKPRHEKKVVDRLSEEEFEVYCPLVKTKVKWSDRWKKVQKPLINGYVFAKVDEKQRIEVLQDQSVVACVTWAGRPAVVQDAEIEAMRALLDGGSNIEVKQLAPGQKVEVDAGPLSGKKGSVITVNGNKARVVIENLGIVITAELSMASLKAIEAESVS